MSCRFIFALTRFLIIYQYISSVTESQSNLTVINQVQAHFARLNSADWLENSNKIGTGYNPLYGSPVCYTGSCQMDGFKHSIYNLKYLSPKPGSCIQKLIPEHVEVDCLPSTTWDAKTETISTLHELHESIINKVEIPRSAFIRSVEFSYITSISTRYAIDNIVKYNKTIMKTTAEISYVKLSMFEPKMALSDEFQFVIDNLPCCDYDKDIEEYIYEYIFNYFGYTFLTSILLGGIAQQTMLVNTATYEKLKNSRFDINNEVKIEFFASVGGLQQYRYDKNRHNQFMNMIQEKHTTTLGGSTPLATIEDWSKTVLSNPVIIKFSLRSIFDLLTPSRFPHDLLIQNKTILIKQALNNYLNRSIYCYGNCSAHGICVPSSYFQFGICHCIDGYSGFDCSISPVPSIGPILIDEKIGKEIILRYNTDIKSQSKYYTDANGREVLERERNFRPTWNYTRDEPVSSNYYPMKSRIWIKENNRQFTILTDRSEGDASMNHGSIKIMFHRRTINDDSLGIGEPLNEFAYGQGLVVCGKHLIIKYSNSSALLHRVGAQRLYMYPLATFRLTQQTYTDYSANFHQTWSPLNDIIY